MFWAIFGAVFFASLAMLVREGLWSNTIALINIIISGLVAFGFYSPLTVFLDEQLSGQYTYVLDFVVIWFLYALTMVICRAATQAASKTRMRFKHPIDPIGGPVMAVLAAWVMATIVMATLHTSPMPKDAFGGKLIHNDNEVDSAPAMSAPDLAWLRFVGQMSAADAFGTSKTDHFGAKGFVKFYGDHREKLEKADAPWLKVRRGGG